MSGIIEQVKDSIKNQIEEDLMIYGHSIWVDGVRQDPNEFFWHDTGSLLLNNHEVLCYKAGLDKCYLSVSKLNTAAALKAVQENRIEKLQWDSINLSD